MDYLKKFSFLKKALYSSDYRMRHTAPVKEEGTSLDNPFNIYPEDLYSAQGVQYYGAHHPADAEAHRIVKSAKNKPTKIITVYRAVPKNLANADINPGDWVSITKMYAADHGYRQFHDKGGYRLIKKEVNASELYTDGNSLHEWGYNP